MKKIIQKLFLFTILVFGFMLGLGFTSYSEHIQVQAQQLCSFCNTQYNQCASECAAGDVGSNCIGEPDEFQCCIDGPGNPASCQAQFDQCEATCVNPTATPQPTNTPPPTPTQQANLEIAGRVFKDLNNSNSEDGGDVGFPGLQVALSAGQNPPNFTPRTTTTNSNGNYSFTSLPSGSYSVVVTTPANFNPINSTGNGRSGIVIPPSVSNINIGFVPSGTALQSCTIVGPTTLVVGQSQNYTATLNPTNASLATYTWTLNGPNVFSVATHDPVAVVNPTATGTYTLGLTITDTIGNARQCNNGNLLSITVTGGATPTPNTTIAPTATGVPTATVMPTITTCPGCSSPTPIPPTATPTNTGQPTAYRIRNAVDSNSCQSALSSANSTQMQAGQTTVIINSWDLLGTGDLGTPASGSLKTVCGQFQVDGVWGTPFFGQITYTGTNPTETPAPTTCPTCPTNTPVPTATITPTIPPNATPTPTTIPNTCITSDCPTCSIGAFCTQVPGVATKQCSCQFPTTPTPTPTSIPNTCGVNDCSSCAVGASCTQVPNVATRQCTCQFVPTGTPTPTAAPTAAPNATLLFLSVNLEGFTGTYTPTRKEEPVEVKLASASATAVGANGVLAYSAISRHFEGQIDLGTTIVGGQYNLTVKPVSYLAKDFGTVTLTSATVNFIPFSQQNILLSCDLNNDNVVNILDIGQVYTDIKGPANKDSLADIDRNGTVDIFDHNYCVQNFLKEGVPL